MQKTSIIVPCCNEETVLPKLFEKLGFVVETLGMEYEIILVDDGSTDRTWELLKLQSQKNPRWRCLSFARNFGQQAAISAGLYHSTGDVVAVMDADLQDPPEDLMRLFEEWGKGYDVVYGIRQKRKEGWVMRLVCWGFYRLMARLAPYEMPLDSGDFCLMSRRVVDVINSMPERSRFIRGLRAWSGFRQRGVVFERAARAAGNSKYNFPKLFKLALDGLSSCSILPLRLATYLGLCVSAIAFLGLVFVLLQKIFAGQFARLGLVPSPEFLTILISVMFIGGVQLICLGILGEYVGRIYDEVKHRPLWVIGDSANISPKRD